MNKEERTIVETPKLHWTAHLWPGLPHLWNRGSWAGLALAVGFTALACTLLATLVFHEWMVGKVRWIACGALLTIWLLAWLESRADWRRHVAEWRAEGDPDQLFREAQQSYLAGDWVTTEQLLVELLKRDAQDIEGRLMLATLWQHTDRLDEANKQLDHLERMEAAAEWQHEITNLRKSCVSAVPQDERIPEEPNRRLSA